MNVEELAPKLIMSFVSIMLNIGEIVANIDINEWFTFSISGLTVIYLIVGITQKITQIKRLKDEE